LRLQLASSALGVLCKRKEVGEDERKQCGSGCMHMAQVMAVAGMGTTGDKYNMA